MNHVMIDIETLGQEAGCVILSIGAVRFDLATGEMNPNTFFVPLDIDNQVELGLKIDPKTMMWWFARSKDEQATMTLHANNGWRLQDGLRNLTDFLNPNDQVWARGPRFDLAILAHAYKETLGLDYTPWNYNNERCVRTMEMFNPHIKEIFDKQRGSVKHDPVQDCVHQIRYISAIYQSIPKPQ